MFLAEKLGEWDKSEPIDDHTEWITLLAASPGVQYAGYLVALSADNQKGMVPVAIEDKAAANGPQVPNCPKHSFPVELIETILCINAASDEGVVNWCCWRIARYTWGYRVLGCFGWWWVGRVGTSSLWEGLFY